MKPVFGDTFYFLAYPTVADHHLAHENSKVQRHRKVKTE